MECHLMACCSYDNASLGPGYKKTHSLLEGFEGILKKDNTESISSQP
jgi:hypothetical protein